MSIMERTNPSGSMSPGTKKGGKIQKNFTFNDENDKILSTIEVAMDLNKRNEPIRVGFSKFKGDDNDKPTDYIDVWVRSEAKKDLADYFRMIADTLDTS